MSIVGYCRLIAGLAIVGPSIAISGEVLDEHLVPESSVFTEPYLQRYHSMVIEVLSKGMDNNAELKMYYISSPVEYAVAISAKDEIHTVSVIRAKKLLWMYEIYDMTVAGQIQTLGEDGERILGPDEDLKKTMASYPTDYRQVGVDIESTQIDKETYELVRKAWRAMLVRTKYPRLDPENRVIGLDGVTYHFSSLRPPMAGNVWSPTPESNTGMLVQIAREIARLAAGEQERRAMITENIHNLANQLLTNLSSDDHKSIQDVPK